MTVPKTLILDPLKARFLSSGLDTVNGWLVPSTALYLAGIETMQRGSVDGGICEIGVHRGKSFLAMTIAAPAGDTKLAIDVFDLQDLNEDGKSVGAKAAFEHHLDEWDVSGVDVMQGSSLELAAQGFLDGGPRFRLFSVDGGHGAKYVRNDLDLAESTLVRGGIVAADDVFNQHWLGVCTGFFEYLHAGGQLRPFALIPNKLLLTDAASVDQNRDELRQVFGDGIGKAGVEFVGGVIDVYADIDWTIVDATGHEAPLQRRVDNLADVRAVLAGARLELSRVQHDLRRVKSHNSALHERLRDANRMTAEADARRAVAEDDVRQMTAQTLKSTPRESVARRLGRHLPAPVQGPARAVYRRLRAVAHATH
jgi:hypothetical protein